MASETWQRSPSPVESANIHAPAGLRALSAFFLLGLMLSLLGAVLPVWGYHLRPDFTSGGHYFIFMAVGVVGGVCASYPILRVRSVSYALVLGAALSSGALLYLALASPPVSTAGRLAGVMLLGFGAGPILHAASLAIWSSYRHNPAATANLAGASFVSGCLLMALLVGGTYYIYTVPSILFLLAVVPGLFACYYARHLRGPDPPARPQPLLELWRDLRSPAAVLSALLLFFQFGNEWAIAGWLPVFLIQRLGFSPELALHLLAFYWAILLVGRVVAQFLLLKFRHGYLLLCSVLAAQFGCVILLMTKTTFGAASGILFLGGGFAMILPLLIEKIGFRFPDLPPSFYTGFFAFAMSGGLLAPWSLSYFAGYLGIRAVMLLPLAGMTMVAVLLTLIWLEATLSGTDRLASGSK